AEWDWRPRIPPAWPAKSAPLEARPSLLQRTGLNGPFSIHYPIKLRTRSNPSAVSKDTRPIVPRQSACRILYRKFHRFSWRIRNTQLSCAEGVGRRLLLGTTTVLVTADRSHAAFVRIASRPHVVPDEFRVPWEGDQDASFHSSWSSGCGGDCRIGS